MRRPYAILSGDGPIIATAIHSGHDLREQVRKKLLLTDEMRFYEEDPYTEMFSLGADSLVTVYRSRFEVDLNRPREKSVYVSPEDAWGLNIWSGSLTLEMVEESLATYDSFYRDIENFLEAQCKRFGKVVVLDLHSYCHRRNGPNAPAEPVETNPDINVGTGSLQKQPWRSLVDSFVNELKHFETKGQHLNVGENIRFKGGHFSQWAHTRFPSRVCVLALEFKKFFMDEWTGEIDYAEFYRASAALRSAINVLRKELAGYEVPFTQSKSA